LANQVAVTALCCAQVSVPAKLGQYSGPCPMRKICQFIVQSLSKLYCKIFHALYASISHLVSVCSRLVTVTSIV